MVPNNSDRRITRLSRITESRVIEMWQKRLRSDRRLTADSGQSIEIIYPGRRNDDRGADFRDATVIAGGAVMQGCIEVHARKGDWQAHHHHLDPVYNQVVLHVALADNAGTVTVSQSGKSVPTVVLEENTGGTRPPGRHDRGVVPCPGTDARLPPKALLEQLESAGEARFLGKAAAFQAGPDGGAGECLYQGIMGALGYARNQLPFMELGRRVALSLLESTFRNIASEEEYVARVQALLAGSAGLLPSQRPLRQSRDDAWTSKLEHLWAEMGQPQAMSGSDWHLFKVRPGNFPVRRIAAMSHLLYRWRVRGLLEEMLRLANESDRDYRQLGKAFMVSDTGYWATHFDFGSDCYALTPVLIGRERAAEMVVNVFLPFIYARCSLSTSTAPGEKVLNLYRGYPKLATNSVERHMLCQLGLKGRLVSSARRQQGLLHIYKTLCAQGKCGECSLVNIKHKYISLTAETKSEARNTCLRRSACPPYKTLAGGATRRQAKSEKIQSLNVKN